MSNFMRKIIATITDEQTMVKYLCTMSLSMNHRLKKLPTLKINIPSL